ncbi:MULTISPECIES: hypothetical protein [unclassified Streptomyces]|uniref:hypothetical protein n=1 Tax=unclassified Streptomyces TaxID=2593676 RepID=UPI0037002528
MVRLDGPRTGPVDDPVRTPLVDTPGADADTVVINGRTVLRAGRIPGADETAWRVRAQDVFDRVKHACAGRDCLHRGTTARFPARGEPTA